MVFQAVTDRLEADPAPVASRSSTDPGSSSSIASNGGSDMRTRHSSGVSGVHKDDMDDVDAYELTGCMSLLVRPKLVWKQQQQQQQRGGDLLGELWNPCGAAFLPGDDGLVVAEYDMASARNNKICIFDATGAPLGWLGSVVVGRRTSDRKIASSTPGRCTAG